MGGPISSQSEATTYLGYSLRNPASPVYLRLLEVTDAQAVLAAYLENRDFLAPWEPSRDSDFFSLENMQTLLATARQSAEHGQAYSFGIFLVDNDRLVGRITLSTIVRGVWQNAYLGYWVGQVYNGQGFATWAIRLAVEFAFQELQLHRVTAATLTHNQASQRALLKVGFQQEGLVRRYLKINGQWQDHLQYALIGDD